ncbi:hemerythrin domain-containing protein [Amycolatopsis sp. H20-H5]|nr:hemerythrin domain-containing protein [Amycolatopsis sp. H20-H5]
MDITSLILDDHDRFRREFAAMDDLTEPEDLAKVWGALGDLLDVHAAAEEAIFYPELLHRGDDAEDETLDAVGDHNDIRDGVRDAAQHPVGSDEWSAAVHRARMANSEHMAEEEDGALADFRRHSPPGLREELGRKFLAFKEEHAGTKGLDVSDVDPKQYVRENDPN